MFALAARGCDKFSIGSQLGMSPETARTHLSNIMTKLEVRSRAGLVAAAAAAGLDTTPEGETRWILDHRPVKRPDLEVVNRSGEHALYEPDTGELHELNATSMAIWEACDGETTLSELVGAIQELGGVDIDTAQELVLSAVSSLERSRPACQLRVGGLSLLNGQPMLLAVSSRFPAPTNSDSSQLAIAS